MHFVALQINSFKRAVNLNDSSKVRPFLEHSCAILSSFKFVIIFNDTSADFILITILKELRIAQLCSKNERTLHHSIMYHEGAT